MGDGDESADVQIVDTVHHLRVGLRVCCREAPMKGSEEQLADFFFRGHFL